jgi:hypothetical protein
MKQEKLAFKAFPVQGLMLQDFARVACRAEWEAWEQAEKQLASAGGRPAGSRLLPFHFEYSSHPVTANERKKARGRAAQAAKDLATAVLNYLKGYRSTSCPFQFRGMLHGACEPVYIWSDLLANTLRVDLETSTIVIRGGSRFAGVRVFKDSHSAVSTSATDAPTYATDRQAGSIVIRGSVRASPFTPKEVAGIASLQHALDQLVFNHPRVELLRKQAKAAMEAAKQPFYDNAGLLSPVYGHDEEMMALKSFVGRDKLMSRGDYERWTENSKFKDTVPRWPKEYDDFCDEIELRACALIEMLKSGQLECVCYTARTKERESLLPTVWTREEYYVLPRTGDIFETKPMKMVPRWTGVVLQLPARIEAEAVHEVESGRGLISDPVDRIAGRTLVEAFRCFVLDDAQLCELLKKANAVEEPADQYFEPGDKFSFEAGYCLGPQDQAIWPVKFEDSDLCKVVNPDSNKRSPVGWLQEPDPPEFIAMADEFTRLYGSFIETLRTGQIEAHCVPVASGHPAVIPRSIWSHRDFYFDANTGDVFEANPEAEVPPKDWLVKRWIGAELRRKATTAAQSSEETSSPSSSSATPDPKAVNAPAGLTTKEQAVHFAVVALWPTGTPAGLKSMDRDKQILDWQKAEKLSVSSSSTIKRYFQKMKRPSAKRPSLA